MRFAICNEIFKEWDLDRVFAYVARLGYHGVEIAPFTMADSVVDISKAERLRVRELAERHNIEIAGIHWVLVKPEGLYINHPDAELRKRTAAYFCELVNFCADIGGSRMILGSPRQRNVLPNVSQDQARAWTLETLSEAVKRAEQRGVIICFEPLGPAETNFINSAAAAINLISELPSKSFQIILDVKAMSSESKPIAEIIRESWPHFAHFHANDPNLKGPGFGNVQFKPIADALKQVGYSGFVSVEVFNFEDGPEAIAGKSLQCLQTAFA
ncbi:MAG TPA: sugar phosphate isomerase/epimerase family protein [Verrucomicrobiae bacterium]|nr:sugar phosphate isomerase/epimerase family protein [Verrucomicrobiae bacterium]